MKLYYRISDKSYQKDKVPGATKQSCFRNFVWAFADILAEPNQLTILADNCESETLTWVKNTEFPVLTTNLGNAGSLQYALELAIKENPENELVYFCEDDYLHRDVAPTLLMEGIKRADYITLYDHPDKYTRQYDLGEISKVIRTASSHWRYTISTCMTFGVRVGTLKEDMTVWKEFTSDQHPWDHEIFKKLTKEQNRRLGVCIPGSACHTDLTVSGQFRTIMIEPWAITLMIQQLEERIALWFVANGSEAKPIYDDLVGQKKGWERLVALDVFLSQVVLDLKS